MATNVYRSESSIFFDGTTPSSFYGWYVSTNAESMQLDHFDSAAAREDFVQKVTQALQQIGATDTCEDRVAGLLALRLYGAADQSEYATLLLEGELDIEKAKALEDLFRSDEDND